MKYLIKGIKIENVIFKYLDNQDFVIHNNNKKFNNYIYFLNSESDKISQISVYVKNAIGEVRNWVYVNDDLIQELSNFFSIDKSDCLNIIKVWVSDTLNIRVGEVIDTSYEDFHRLKVI
jgi:hypothetical protein